MAKIDIIIWSFDRACQVDLLLRSIKDKFKSAGDVYVLYHCSSDEFAKGYSVVQSIEYSLNIHWIRQGDFEKNTRDILGWIKTPCFLPLSDDDVFVNEVTVSDKIIDLLAGPEYNAFSLKGGLNITHNYPNWDCPQPNFTWIDQDILSWVWGDSPRQLDWGYPSCVNAYVFNRDYYLQLIYALKFNRPVALETELNLCVQQRIGIYKTKMMCYKQSSLLNLPVNRVQPMVDNPFGEKFAITTKELNDKFLNGEQISTSNIYDKPMHMPNEELPFIFEKA